MSSEAILKKEAPSQQREAGAYECLQREMLPSKLGVFSTRSATAPWRPPKHLSSLLVQDEVLALGK